MGQPRIEPEKITKPIQLTAVWFGVLICLVGAFLTGAVKIKEPPWVAAFLCLASVGLVVVVLLLVFLLQTRFRPQLQADTFYADWCKRQEKLFAHFKPENKPDAQMRDEVPGVSLRNLRRQRYEQQHGLFLVHTWRPSSTPGQVADIIIKLHQHNTGPLSRGEVTKVEYDLGPKFFNAPVEKRNARDAFKMEVSAYGPMLCLARAFIRGTEEPVQLERYIDFELPRS